MLSIEQYIHLCDRLWSCIHGKGAQGVERIRARSVYFIWYRNMPLIAAWDAGTMQISTFLYRDRPLTARAQDMLLRQYGRNFALRRKIQQGTFTLESPRADPGT